MSSTSKKTSTDNRPMAGKRLKKLSKKTLSESVSAVERPAVFALYEKMRNATELVKDRAVYFRTYKNCFVGMEATKWIVTNFAPCKKSEDAEYIGNLMMEMGLIRHVKNTHSFRNKNYYYIFTEEKEKRKLRRKSTVPTQQNVMYKLKAMKILAAPLNVYGIDPENIAYEEDEEIQSDSSFDELTSLKISGGSIIMPGEEYNGGTSASSSPTNERPDGDGYLPTNATQSISPPSPSLLSHYPRCYSRHPIGGTELNKPRANLQSSRDKTTSSISGKDKSSLYTPNYRFSTGFSNTQFVSMHNYGLSNSYTSIPSLPETFEKPASTGPMSIAAAAYTPSIIKFMSSNSSIYQNPFGEGSSRSSCTSERSHEARRTLPKAILMRTSNTLNGSCDSTCSAGTRTSDISYESSDEDDESPEREVSTADSGLCPLSPHLCLPTIDECSTPSPVKLFTTVSPPISASSSPQYIPRQSPRLIGTTPSPPIGGGSGGFTRPMRPITLTYSDNSPPSMPSNSYPLKRSRSNSIFHDECDNWNARFQDIVKDMRRIGINSTMEERSAVNIRFLELSRDFIHAAKTYGRIIISERYLRSKTIKPYQAGGLAGGEKYVVHNIMFKFAVDSNKILGSDYAAAKVAGNELRGLISYFNCGVPDLHVPMMALVDYLGFRLIAMALLPVSTTTMVYGTCDGGYTILNKTPRVSDKMKIASKKLNLRSHLCGLKGTKGVTLHSASDIEGHIGLDGRIYLVDFSRTMPPVKPDPTLGVGHLYQLFRPEFVKLHNRPLCPDAFSGFVEVDPNVDRYNSDIIDATNQLLDDVACVAVQLGEAVLAAKQKGLIAQLSIANNLHTDGINMKLIGRAIAELEKKDSEKYSLCISLLLAEAAIRVIKYFTRLKLREKMKSLEEPLRCTTHMHCVTDYTNLVFGNTPASNYHWNFDIKHEMQQKFNVGGQYISASFDLKKVMDVFINPDFDPTATMRLLMFNRFQQMTGVQFTKIAQEKFEVFAKNNIIPAYPFDYTDLETVGEHVKHMGIINEAHGSFYFYKAMECKSGKDLISATHFFNLAIQKYQLALTSTPGSNIVLRNVAVCIVRLIEIQQLKSSESAEEETILSLDDPQVQEAITYFHRSLEINRKTRTADPETLYHYAKLLWQCYVLDKAEKYFLRSLEAEPNYIDALEDYSKFLSAVHKDNEAASQFNNRALKLKHLQQIMSMKSASAPSLHNLPY